MGFGIRTTPLVLAAALAAAVPTSCSRAQDGPPRTAPPPPPAPVTSPEVAQDGRITFRIRAPKAEAVRLGGSDLPGLGQGVAMTKAEGDVWTATIGPVPAGAYRYNFDVDGVAVIDPANPATSESNMNTWSLVTVPGSEVSDTRDVPHGAVAEVTYYSKSLGRPRRMHVYTPPGYESGEGRFPVLYLLHGASDSDDSWSTVGRAGFILDNLIAAGKAKPMIVAMPAGHTAPFRFGAPRDPASDMRMKEFVTDFVGDIRPYVEAHYRLEEGRAYRAVAGLSMGGAQTLEIAAADLTGYAYVGVFSSGIFGIVPMGPPGPAPAGPSWEEQHKAALDDAAAKQGLELVWFATGKEDFLIETSRATVKMLDSHGFGVVFRETEGAHTWTNWRDYLAEFAQLLFRPKAPGGA
jgi:enterochelin esterase-like enzyme